MVLEYEPEVPSNQNSNVNGKYLFCSPVSEKDEDEGKSKINDDEKPEPFPKVSMS